MYRKPSAHAENFLLQWFECTACLHASNSLILPSLSLLRSSIAFRGNLLVIKTLLVPILEYPPIPLCSASKSQKLKLQTVQNKALRFINYNDEERIETVKELHEKYNFLPINISLNKKARKIYETLRRTDVETYNNVTRPIEGTHNWFPKTSRIITEPTPNPLYTGRGNT